MHAVVLNTHTHTHTHTHTLHRYIESLGEKKTSQETIYTIYINTPKLARFEHYICILYTLN